MGFCADIRISLQSPLADAGNRLSNALPPGTKIATEGGGMWELEIPLPDSKDLCRRLAGAFRTAESMKADLQIKQYSVAMTTLEQVFMRLVRESETEKEDIVG